MTHDDLEDIKATEGHKHFLRLLFTENLVLFVGISADDIAISMRLLELTDGGFRPKNLYWLTNRLDPEAERWADRAYVSLIRYEALSNSAHSDAIHVFVQSCLKFVSVDSPQSPLIGSSDELPPFQIIQDPEDLANRHPEEIRKSIAFLLDKKLREADVNDELFIVYRKFCDEYDYPVHRAFYKGKANKYRTWFGYNIEMPALGEGNFGEVYSARDNDGNLVAIKIMHESIFGKDDMLGGFRRGVRSMEIVTSNNVSGMMPIIRSFELPPTIVMPFIAGQNLEASLTARPNLSWLVKLNIARKIGRIVAAGHALPETILHRDLKPSNIMITNFEYHGDFDPDIMVLDFDMSWHKGSKERDITFESRDDFGYLAPEQTDVNNKNGARSTRVDAYGFGMTLFYIFGLESPRPNEALSELWPTRAVKAAARGYDGNWLSASNRLGIMISQATKIDQKSRIDFASMVRELDYVHAAVTDPARLENPELWAEEVLASVANGLPYEWEQSSGRGVFQNPSGISVHCMGDFRELSVQISIRYADRGVTQRTGLSRYLGAALTNTERLLRLGGWQTRDRQSGGREAAINAFCKLVDLQKGTEPFVAVVSAMKEFRFND